MDLVIRRRSAAFLGVLLAASIVAVSGSVYLNARAQRIEADSRERIEHSYEVKLLLGEIFRRVGDLETGALGYALTSQADFLEPMLTAQDILHGQTVTLSFKLADDMPQFERAKQLSDLIRLRVLHAQGMVDLTREQAAVGEIAVYVRGGKILTDQIRGLMTEMLSVEKHLLAQRAVAHTRDAALSHRLAWLLVAMQVLLWAALFVVVRQAIRVQAIVTVCSWSKTICYQDEWITFEEYLRRRFGVQISHGISPAETEKFLRTLPGATPNEGAGISFR